MNPTEYLAANDARIHHELFDFLRIPSVSARSEHAKDVARGAEWVATSLRDAGLDAKVHPTAGHPVVVGEWRKARAGAPTILVYGHYDVQPAEPLDLWQSPPFEPTIRDGRIYARGSVDDKGQLFLHVKALEAHLKTRGTLPVNVIVLAEGEEEVGSEHLAEFIESHRQQLRCDGVIISDSAMFAPGLPSILSSLRGLAYFQIDVRGPSGDLHSGSYGGAVVNPAMALARILATFHDADGRIAIPGFYDTVRDWPESVRAQMRGLPFTDEGFRHEVGAPALGGEKGYTTLERIWTRPTCEVNGLLSGYTGEGAKTVLPAVAMAKVSCRLVPDQDPKEIERLMKAHVERVAPKGVTVTVTHLHGGRPWRADLDGPLFDAAKRALKAAFGREPVITGEGGSIPVVGDFQRILGAPVLLVGFGLPGENAHAPNEWMSDENFVKGMRAIAELWDEIGKGGR
ncbi:MAG: dipeptidase [Gemmatimonadaceae bacterium]|nr:dipeptidase [Gemmatimonadaceae bacterium]NUQ91684.1 dipeptidase [Gemmatimonadaceae bacterium]NUR19300.1 dipeptidase [Gemmatimonadaceae bacterium]